jgi:hypothetical protein
VRKSSRTVIAQARAHLPDADRRWRLRQRWRPLARINQSSLAPSAGIDGAIGYAIPLVAGQLTGHPREGVIASAGALIIGYADQGDAPRLQAQTVGATVGCVCVAVLLGAFTQPSVIATAAVAAAWAFMAGLTVARGPRVALVATLATWSLLLAGDLRLHGQSALVETALIAAGASIQAAISIGSSRLRSPSLVDAASVKVAGAPSYSHLQTPAVRHASRLAVALVAAVIAYRVLSLGFGYWVPLTALFVLKPSYETTIVRALGRALGTLTGAAAAWLVVAVSNGSTVGSLGLMVCLVGLAITLYRANYALSTIALTTVIALVAQLGGGSPVGALIDRTIDVGVGTLIALAMFLICPTIPRHLNVAMPDELADESQPPIRSASSRLRPSGPRTLAATEDALAVEGIVTAVDLSVKRGPGARNSAARVPWRIGARGGGAPNSARPQSTRHVDERPTL